MPGSSHHMLYRPCIPDIVQFYTLKHSQILLETHPSLHSHCILRPLQSRLHGTLNNPVHRLYINHL